MTQKYIDPFGPVWEFRWLRLIMHWEGSILQMFWMEGAWFVVVYAAVIAIWQAVIRDDQNWYENESIANFRVAVQYMRSRFQAALSLMLGFYMSTIYSRWWEVRRAEGSAMGAINDLAMQMAAFIRDENPQEENQEGDDKEGPIPSPEGASAQSVRLNLVRWLNLSHALAVGDLYEKKPNEFSTLESLVELGLLTELEKCYLQDVPASSRHAAPLTWFLDTFSELNERHKFHLRDPKVVVVSGQLSLVRGSLASLYSFKNTPVPLSYRQLVNIAARLYLVIVALSGGMHAIQEDEDPYNDSSYWLLLPFVFELFLFVGWLTVADALGNPFRTWADEFEWENYVRSITLSSNTSITSTLKACPVKAVLSGSNAEWKEKQEKSRERFKDEVAVSPAKPVGLKRKLTGC